MRFVVFALLALLASPALALDGTFAQGGLVVGHTTPGALVSLDSEAVQVAPDGTFVVGFARDAKPSAVLMIGDMAQTLSIKQRTWDIQRIDGLPKRQVTPDPKAVKRIKADNTLIWGVRGWRTDAAYFASSGFIQPASGRVSGVFGSQRILNGKPKSPHNGLDIAGGKGGLIVAPADGVVALVHDDMFYTGKTVMIDHGLGLSSVYAHMNSVAVTEGQPINQGDTLGTIGQTGRATGPHLHWGVTWKGVHLDPALVAGPVANSGLK